jgi:hypothetical protein
MGGMPQAQREKGAQQVGSKFAQSITPPPVEQQTKPKPDREQIGMTTQRKKTEETRKQQQKASLTGTSLEDAGKTVLGG